MSTDLKGLSEYLRKSKDKTIDLSLDKIEEIIKNKLPDKAKTAKWWYNNAHYFHAKAWLGNGYRTTSTSSVPLANHVIFEKTEKFNFLKKIWNNAVFRWVFDFIIVSVTIQLLLTHIQTIQEKTRVAEENIQIIERRIMTADLNGIEDSIYTVTPYLEENHKYLSLCKYYKILLERRCNEFAETENITDSDNIKSIEKLGQQCLKYSSEAESAYYNIFFYNLMGGAYYSLYEKTLDVSYAEKAASLYGYGNYSFLHSDILPPWNESKIDTCLTGIQNYMGLFEIYYSLIQNGEYSEAELSDLKKPFDVTQYIHDNLLYLPNNCFLLAIGSHVSSDNFLYYLLSEIKDTSYLSYVIEQPIIHQQLALHGRFYALMYLVSMKYGIDLNQNFRDVFNQIYALFDVNTSIIDKTYLDKFGNDEGWFIDDYSIQYDDISMINRVLTNTIDTAKTYELYDVLSATYFSLAQVNFLDYMYNDNDSSFERFSIYIDLFDALDDYHEINYAFDKYFEPITGGDLLSEYIEQQESTLKHLSYKKNPSFYSYTAWELGRHYRYKADELKNLNGDRDAILENLHNAIKYCNLAFEYFTPEKNIIMCEKVYDELLLIESSIDNILSVE